MLPDNAIFLSGPWPRARETATILQPAVDATLEVDERLRELDPGEADGLTWDEYSTRFGDFDMFAEPDRPFAPGGESYAMFSARICDTLDNLARTHPDSTVVAVAHGGTVVVSMVGLLGIPRPGTGAILKPDYTGLTIWNYTDHWLLERFNDTAHLESQHQPT
jgi:probable phosphoglycerate mutase